MSKPGSYKGEHYTEYVDKVKGLKRAGNLDKVEKLVLGLVDAVEKEARAEGHGVAPWYYEQLAIVYRKQKRYKAEIAILERYARQRHAPGATGRKLIERLEKVIRLSQSE